MGSLKNLHTLHEEEEKLRERSLASINQRPDLRDHLAIVAEAMDVIWAFSHDHTNENEDELTLQLFGIRLFNAAAASIKLALSGYYQKAFDPVRDIIETGFLVDYLISHPSEIPVWRAADKKIRKTRFGPDAIRRALDKRDGYTGEKRKMIYDLLSEAASHASFKGFALIASADTNLGEIGPFFDEKKLAGWLQELAFLCPRKARTSSYWVRKRTIFTPCKAGHRSIFPALAAEHDLKFRQLVKHCD